MGTYLYLCDEGGPLVLGVDGTPPGLGHVSGLREGARVRALRRREASGRESAVRGGTAVVHRCAAGRSAPSTSRPERAAGFGPLPRVRRDAAAAGGIVPCGRPRCRIPACHDPQAGRPRLSRRGRPGKSRSSPPSRCSAARASSLAYTPGVAGPCLAIADDPEARVGVHRAATWWPSSATARRCWAWATWRRLEIDPVMEGKELPLRVRRHRSTSSTSSSICTPGHRRHPWRARADLWGHQPRGHQGAQYFFIEEELKKRLRSRCSTTTNMERRSSPAPRSSTPASSSAKSHALRIVVSGAGASAIACANFYVEARLPARQRHAHRHGGRGLRGAGRTT